MTITLANAITQYHLPSVKGQMSRSCIALMLTDRWLVKSPSLSWLSNVGPVFLVPYVEVTVSLTSQ